MNKFAYVKYDDVTSAKSAMFKKMVEDLQQQIELLGAGREQQTASYKLEECFMWIGKALKEEQIRKDGTIKHLPERSDS